MCVTLHVPYILLLVVGLSWAVAHSLVALSTRIKFLSHGPLKSNLIRNSKLLLNRASMSSKKIGGPLGVW